MKTVARKVPPSTSPAPVQNQGWTFLTNHTHVLVCLARNPTETVRQLAILVGITERSVQRILKELEESGVVTRHKEGRCNRYRLNERFKLRHPLEATQNLKGLLELLR